MKLPALLLICSCVSVPGLCGAYAPNLEAQTKPAAQSSKNSRKTATLQDSRQEPKISTSLSAIVNQFTIGQDVTVTLTIKNISNQSVPLRTAPHYYHVYVEGASGEVEKTRFYHRLRGEFLPGESELRGGVTFEIEPGKSGTKDFDLTKYYKLQEAGEYRVYIECDDESGTWVRSNTVSFELKAPN